MPQNKKPAGTRPAKNFDPKYAPKTSYQDRKRRPDAVGATKPGSKSPSHRGYRAQSEDTAPTKRRWNADERAAREGTRPAREAGSYDRPRRSFDQDAAPRRGASERSSGGPRRDFAPRQDRSDRPRRDFNDRPRQDRDDRPHQGFAPRRDFNDRPRQDRDDRPRRDFNDRPRQDRDDRPRRESNDRPRRESASRPNFTPRPDRNDRPRRDSSDRPRRTDTGNRSDWNAQPKSKAHEDHIDVVHERLQAEAVDATITTGESFGDLGLGQNLVRVLNDLGAPHPFPIQAATIKPILDGRDVLARGRTGSGKTIAFGAPLVESVLRAQAGAKRDFGRKPRALIMAPTRELALQIDRTVQALARSVGLFTTQIYGGVPQARQVGALRKGVDIIIGTPGRIEDLVNQGKLDLSEVSIAVLDEADHMCELGFLEPVQRILRHTADSSQKLLFSATLDREVAALVDEFLVEPAVYEVAGEDQDSGTIDHRVIVIDHRDKAEILTSLVDRDGKTLVFARTRAYAEMLAEQFDEAGISAVALHGDLNQAKRTRNLQRLTSGRVNVLVATDVAARGIHVDDIDLVIQADPPDEYKTYLHRSGRTGRAGRLGTVVTIITRQRRRRMTEMLDRAEIEAPFDDVRIGDDLIEELSGRQLANVTA
ncbi:superfamily II DNA/RNA helicase [Microbacterium halimionae]|uniref:Superfamily II DNA/RNA helicase n=1 Tax=Microbacterium halimionae TaxID=1526413 RepID=A0A7W3JLN9_9MICO|nr:DEAD/DEAH box helicase [Microbacterium halimionae]MBA8814984.1 superfamily II DNA/RNA helicase [Microbacterium halimionae]NII94225.1 superfamily II DNA/RNA helicase [Microbacterium halimionae]